jgi:hypothetical protein
MLLSALLMSAAVQASPVASPAPPLVTPLPTPGRPAYWKIRSDCAVFAPTPTPTGSGSAPEGRAPTGVRYAVLRQVDGCPVPTPAHRSR